jgi:hypothetical protein
MSKKPIHTCLFITTTQPLPLQLLPESPASDESFTLAHILEPFDEGPSNPVNTLDEAGPRFDPSVFIRHCWQRRGKDAKLFK